MRALLLAVLLVWASPAAAGGGAGESPFDSLFIDASARPTALGGAYSAMSSDESSLLYNPAGLAGVRRHGALFSYNEHAQGVRQQYLGLAFKQGWGLGVGHIDSGAIPRTTLSNPEGTGLDSARLSDLLLAAGYGWAFSDLLSVGAAGKFLRESIDGRSLSAYAADVGLLITPPGLETLRVAGVLQNLGPTVRRDQARENLPATARLGAALELPLRDQPLIIAVEAVKTRAERPVYGAGLESPLGATVAARLGYSTRYDAGPGLTAGLGWRRRDLSIDYAFLPFGALGGAHRVSLTLRWGKHPLQTRHSFRDDERVFWIH